MIHNSSPSSGAAAAKRAIDPEDNNPAAKKARSSSEETQRTSPGLLSPNEKSRSRSNSACGNELQVDVQERLVAISEKDKRLIVKFEKPEIQLLEALRELEKVSFKEIVCFRQVKHKSSKVDFLFAKGRKDETSNFRHLLLLDCKNKDLESARMKFGKNEAKVKKAITANNAAEADKLRRNLIDFASNKGLFLYNTKEAAEICKPVRADKVQEQFFATSYVDEFLNPGKLFSYLNGLLDEEKETVALFFPKGVSEWKTKTSIEQSKGQWSWLNSVLSQFEQIEKRSKTSTEGKDYTNKLGQCLKEALEKYVGENDCEDAHVKNLIEMIRSESEEK